MKVQALILLLATSSAVAQGTFQNLDFEAATGIPGVGHPSFQFAQAFPGWTGYLGTNQASSAGFNSISVGTAYISLHTLPSLGGVFCVLLQGGTVVVGPSQDYLGDASIAQSGQLPTDARSIQFKASGGPALGGGMAPGAFSVTFAGNNIPLAILTSQTTYNLYGGDITQFAGQTGELRFTGGFAYLDDIQFSPSTIPEPSVFALSALATALLSSRLLRGSRARQ